MQTTVMDAGTPQQQLQLPDEVVLKIVKHALEDVYPNYLVTPPEGYLEDFGPDWPIFTSSPWRELDQLQYADGSRSYVFEVLNLAQVSTAWLQACHIIFTPQRAAIRNTHKWFWRTQQEEFDSFGLDEGNLIMVNFCWENGWIDGCGYRLAQAMVLVTQRKLQAMRERAEKCKVMVEEAETLLRESAEREVALRLEIAQLRPMTEQLEAMPAEHMDKKTKTEEGKTVAEQETKVT